MVTIFSFVICIVFGDIINMKIDNINQKINRFLDKHLSGHISFLNITIYGRNAMKWGVNIHTKKWGYICFNLPIFINGEISKLYFYISPNGTPWASTYYLYGASKYNQDKLLSCLRKESFGHNFNTYTHGEELNYINQNARLPMRIMRERVINDLLG